MSSDLNPELPASAQLLMRDEIASIAAVMEGLPPHLVGIVLVVIADKEGHIHHDSHMRIHDTNDAINISLGLLDASRNILTSGGLECD